MFNLKSQNTYNQIADNFSRTRTQIWPVISEYLKNLRDGNKVLDLGCGNGRLLNGIKAKIEYTGVDFSRELIKKARDLHPNNKFIVADILEDSTWNNFNKFNAIFCVAVLHHFPDKKQHIFILDKIYKHLEKDGFVVVTVWNLWKNKRLIHHFKHGSLKLKFSNFKWMNALFINKYPIFCYAFTKFELQTLFKKSGFSKINIFYADRKGEFTNILKGNNIVAFANK